MVLWTDFVCSFSLYFGSAGVILGDSCFFVSESRDLLFRSVTVFFSGVVEMVLLCVRVFIVCIMLYLGFIFWEAGGFFERFRKGIL